jgi:signal transduction histidine kinase/DNA-binding response OmpR family regulator
MTQLLPLAGAQVRALPAMMWNDARGAGMAATERLALLLVEAVPRHGPIARQALAGMLAEGSRLEIVATMGAALGRLASGEWDAVATATTLPDGNGLAMLAAVRQAGFPLPVLALAYGERDPIAERMLAEGAAAQLPPPAAPVAEWRAALLRAVPRRIAPPPPASLVDTAPLALLEVSAAGECVRVSGALVGQLELAGCVGHPWSEVQRRLPLAGAQLARAAQGEPVASRLAVGDTLYDIRALPAGEARPAPVLVMVCPAAADDAVNRALLTAKQDAEAANQAKSDYLSAMSHDIRTLMGSVIGMADLLLESDLTADQRQYATAFRQAGNTMLGLVNSIIDLSRLEAGRLPMQRSFFDLGELVGSLAEILSFRARQKQLALIVELDPAAQGRYLGDALRLNQVLLNLLGNALKFTERGEVRLTITVVPEGEHRGWLHFLVADTGAGIPAHQLESVFDTFCQVDVRSARRQGGSGLGLAIVRRLVQGMGGKVRVESKPGAGSRFHVTLPLERVKPPTAATGESRPAPAEVALPVPPAPSAAAPPAGRRLRILVAEDTPDTQVLIRHFLKSTPHQADLVDNGRLAVEHFAAGQYELVLMDMQMPELNGFEATAAIRRLERERQLSPVPVVALTAMALTEDRQRCLDAGCTEYLAKPIRKGPFLELIARYAALVPAP